MSRAFLALLRRDLLLAWRRRGDLLPVMGFLILVAILFPFGLGPEPGLLSRIAPAVLWVGALLANMLALDRLFEDDYRDGALDLLLAGPLAPSLAALAKVLAYWLTTSLPVALASPLIGLALNLPAGGYVALSASLLLGTPVLALLGGVGAALTLGVRRGGLLLAILILPLYIPVLIFGASAVDAAAIGVQSGQQLAFMAAMALAAIALCPWAIAAALRLAVES